MPLIDLTTNLRDLKFGRDRVAGGNSNQPYVRSTIPAPDDESGTLGYLNQDFIVRGGLKAVVNSVKDVERLSKYFSDIRNPSGLLFTALKYPPNDVGSVDPAPILKFSNGFSHCLLVCNPKATPPAWAKVPIGVYTPSFNFPLV